MDQQRTGVAAPPRAPLWWRVLVVAGSVLALAICGIVVHLAPSVGPREVLMLCGAAGLGLLAAFGRNPVTAIGGLVLWVVLGAAGLQVRADPSLDALDAGLSGMVQTLLAVVLLLLAVTLCVVEVCLVRRRQGGRREEEVG